MADAHSIGELEIQEEILKLMQDSRDWSNADLKQKLRHALPWSEADLEVSKERPNELFWEQRVNNALSPARHSSLHSKGHVEHGKERGTHRITEKGLSFIREEWSFEELDAEMSRIQSERTPTENRHGVFAASNGLGFADLRAFFWRLFRCLKRCFVRLL